MYFFLLILKYFKFLRNSLNANKQIYFLKSMIFILLFIIFWVEKECCYYCKHNCFIIILIISNPLKLRPTIKGSFIKDVHTKSRKIDLLFCSYNIRISLTLLFCAVTIYCKFRKIRCVLHQKVRTSISEEPLPLVLKMAALDNIPLPLTVDVFYGWKHSVVGC